jgi:hypothetical protein
MNLELMFTREYLIKLQQKEDDIIHLLTTHVQERDEYATSVGYLRALRELRHVYSDLSKAYFPNN